MFAYIYTYEYIYIRISFENANKGRIWDHMVNNGYIVRVLWDSHDIILGGSPRDGISNRDQRGLVKNQLLSGMIL